jgi:geranylgeranyl pyrophosphate synthase
MAGLLATTLGALCEGQTRELAELFDVARTEESCLLAIEGKTAALMAASCRAGALTAHLPPPSVEALTAFGRSLGMVFQIVDDVLDVVATDEELGKPAGNDLVTGVYTLPVILALRAIPALRKLLGSPLDDQTMQRARILVRSSDAVSSALSVAARYAADAEDSLAPLADGPATEALGALGHELVASVPSPAPRH